MKIGIIGLGFVGQAVAYAHQHNDVVVRDPKLENSADYTDFLDCDAIYVCVPSPSTEDGHCDASILEQTLKELLFVLIGRPIPIICKTTAPPSVYERLQKQYPNVVHCPEFLTASNNIKDYINAGYFVVGGNDVWCNTAVSVIREGVPLVSEKFLITDIKSAALYKYMMNSYLATKVTFMNDFYKLAKTYDIEWNKFAELATWDDRIGYTHMAVPGPDGQFGWGGMCFPKDVAAIQMEALDLNLELELLSRVEDINNKHRQS